MNPKRGPLVLAEWSRLPIHHHPEKDLWHLADGSIVAKNKVDEARLPENHLLTSE